ncbi:MAG TPA: hypothetical protein VH164_00300 [Ktedonobacteraceae bacterium]|nr:hypothetical protein [Ktedonobacteraceae bacterium]
MHSALINGDELTYCGEELYWHMRYGGLLYGVRNPYRWPGMPACEDELEKIRREDRARLEEWVKVQSLKVAPAGATLWDGWTHEPGIEPLTGHGPKPWCSYPGPFLVAEQASAPERQAAVEAAFAYSTREQARAAERKARAKGTDYRQLARDVERASKERAKQERNAQEWAERQTQAHHRKLLTLTERIERRMRTPRYRRSHALAQFALWAASEDHDYIEAMFALYSQGRTRLL